MKFFFTPGPSQLFHTVPGHIRKALNDHFLSQSHRGSAFMKVYGSTRDRLRALFGLSEEWDMVFTNSATEVWERMAQNLVHQNAAFVVSGSFSGRAAEYAGDLGLEVHVHRVGEKEEFHGDSLEPEFQPELINLATNETSTGYQIGSNQIRALRAKFPDSLIALDTVSATPNYLVEPDQVDLFYFSVQKGFGLPSGLGVWLLNGKAVEKAREVLGRERRVAGYRNLVSMVETAKKDQTLATPNMLDIYLLNEVAGDFLEMGLDLIRRDTAYKKALLQHELEQHPDFTPFVQPVQYRSDTTLVYGHPNAGQILETLSKIGMVLGSGYGPHKGHHIRIANFPAHSRELMEQLVDEIKKI